MRAVALGLILGVAVSATANASPARVISVGGSVTETVYALGGQAALIADDQSSVYPAAARALPQVGYMRTLAAEGVLSLHPDLVLAAPEAGPKPVLDQISGAGVKLVKLSEGYTTDAAIGRIAAIGRELGRDTEAKQVVDGLSADLGTVRKQIDAAKSHPRVLFMMQLGHGAPMVAGGKTAADAMIALAGGENAAGAAFDGYKPLTPEAAGALAPDVILLGDESVRALGGRDAVLKIPELAPTPAAKNGRLVALETLYLLGFGPRLAHALHDLAAGLHPEQTFDPLPARSWASPQ